MPGQPRHACIAVTVEPCLWIRANSACRVSGPAPETPIPGHSPRSLRILESWFGCAGLFGSVASRAPYYNAVLAYDITIVNL